MPWVWHTLAQWLRCTSLFYTEKYWNSKKISSRKWNFNWGLLYFEVPAISSIPKLTCHKKSMKNIWIILTREKFLNCAHDEISFFFTILLQTVLFLLAILPSLPSILFSFFDSRQQVESPYFFSQFTSSLFRAGASLILFFSFMPHPYSHFLPPPPQVFTLICLKYTYKYTYIQVRYWCLSLVHLFKIYTIGDTISLFLLLKFLSPKLDFKTVSMLTHADLVHRFLLLCKRYIIIHWVI